MGLPLYDVAARTSQVAASSALLALLPQAQAQGTGRVLRIRQLVVSNTTATAFSIGWGVASAAGATPGGAVTIARRTTSAAIDPPSTATAYTTYATQPTIATYSGRLTVPGNSTVVWRYDDGDELVIPPAATPLPFVVLNTGTGQVADVTLTWEE